MGRKGSGEDGRRGIAADGIVWHGGVIREAWSRMAS